MSNHFLGPLAVTVLSRQPIQKIGCQETEILIKKSVPIMFYLIEIALDKVLCFVNPSWDLTVYIGHTSYVH